MKRVSIMLVTNYACHPGITGIVDWVVNINLPLVSHSYGPLLESWCI